MLQKTWSSVSRSDDYTPHADRQQRTICSTVISLNDELMYTPLEAVRRRLEAPRSSNSVSSSDAEVYLWTIIITSIYSWRGLNKIITENKLTPTQLGPAAVMFNGFLIWVWCVNGVRTQRAGPEGQLGQIWEAQLLTSSWSCFTRLSKLRGSSIIYGAARPVNSSPNCADYVDNLHKHIQHAIVVHRLLAHTHSYGPVVIKSSSLFCIILKSCRL